MTVNCCELKSHSDFWLLLSCCLFQWFFLVGGFFELCSFFHVHYMCVGVFFRTAFWLNNDMMSESLYVYSVYCFLHIKTVSYHYEEVAVSNFDCKSRKTCNKTKIHPHSKDGWNTFIEMSDSKYAICGHTFFFLVCKKYLICQMTVDCVTNLLLCTIANVFMKHLIKIDAWFH